MTPPSPGPERAALPPAKPASGHLIPEDSIALLNKLGTGEFGTVQQGVWTTDEGERVSDIGWMLWGSVQVNKHYIPQFNFSCVLVDWY